MNLVIIGVILAIIIGAPLVVIWALNTLFGLGINYGFSEWVAAYILYGVFWNNHTISIKKG